jgi:hypothetical protein
MMTPSQNSSTFQNSSPQIVGHHRGRWMVVEWLLCPVRKPIQTRIQFAKPMFWFKSHRDLEPIVNRDAFTKVTAKGP